MQPIISISGLTKTYAGGFEALKAVDLEINRGEIFGLLGPNGAGKTTAIGIITSLVNKTSGRVEVFGHSLDKELAAAKACLGVVPQEINLNQFDRLDNIVMNQAGFYGVRRRDARRRAQQVLEQLRLWDRRDDIARNLSGGMKRRLMIARALVHGPRLLILDEPTAGVDIEIRRSMWQFLREINEQGTTIILTTHYLEEAENLCRHVGIIDHGRIVANDRMTSILMKLHREVFLLTTREPVVALPLFDEFDVRLLNERELQVEITRNQDLNGLFRMLSSAGIQVASMRNKSNRLEEVFFRLTDRSGEEPVTHEFEARAS